MFSLADQLKAKSVVQNYLGKDLEWGKTDCMTFFCEMQSAIHGIDLSQFWKDHYSSPKEAIRWATTFQSDNDFFKFDYLVDNFERLEINYTELQLGDAFIYFDRGMPHSMVFYVDRWWSVFADEGFGWKPVNTESKFEIWRFKCHQ